MSREIMRDKEEIKSVYEIHKSKGQMDVRSSLELKVSQKLMAGFVECLDSEDTEEFVRLEEGMS